MQEGRDGARGSSRNRFSKDCGDHQGFQRRKGHIEGTHTIVIDTHFLPNIRL